MSLRPWFLATPQFSLCFCWYLDLACSLIVFAGYTGKKCGEQTVCLCNQTLIRDRCMGDGHAHGSHGHGYGYGMGSSLSLEAERSFKTSFRRGHGGASYSNTPQFGLKKLVHLPPCTCLSSPITNPLSQPEIEEEFDPSMVVVVFSYTGIVLSKRGVCRSNSSLGFFL